MTDANRIFLVEDEAVIALEIEDRLRRLGYEVCGRARSGEEALARIPTSYPDLIVMDIRLAGELSGIETAFRLREQRDLPVVFLSAFSDDELLKNALRAEPFGYLIKPFEGRVLHVTIQAALTKHRLERSLRQANARLEERNAKLAESEAFNRCVLAALETEVVVLDREGRRISADPGSSTFFPDQPADDDYLAGCDAAAEEGDEAAGRLATCLRELLAGQRESFRLESIRGSGRRVLSRGTPYAGAGPGRVVLTHDDVTTTHAALQKAAVSESTLASIGQAVPVGILRTDREGRCLEVSPHWRALTGQEPEQALGEGWKRALHPEDRERLRPTWSGEQVTPPPSGEYRLQRTDGSTAWVVGRSAGVRDHQGDVTGYVKVLTEITDQKRLELALRALSRDLVEQEGVALYQTACRRLAELLEADAAVVCRPNVDGSGVTALALCIDGTSETTAQYPGDWCPFGDLEDSQAIGRDLAARFPENQFLSQGGFQACAVEPLLDLKGNPLGRLGVLFRRPIPAAETQPTLTILKLFASTVAAALTRERTQEHYRNLVEFMPAGLVLTDLEGRIVHTNQRTEELFGWSREELVGQPVEVLVVPEERERHVELRKRYTAAPRMYAMGASARGDLVGYRKDRSTFPAEIDLAPIETEEGLLIAAAVRDVSERTALRTQLSQALKLDALGKLTGGMAHDFNNYLSVIHGNLDLLVETEQLSPFAKRLVASAMAGAERSAELTRSLLAFARRQQLDPKPTDVNERLRAIAKLLDRTLGEDVALSIQLAPEAWCVRIDGPQLDSCLVNLANNARDAMPKGGRLTFRTQARRQGEARPVGLELEPVDYVVVEVTDTGQGMAPEVCAQVFDPFFTTKGPGHGTGLGLSMVFGFVKQSGGQIELDSTVGAGTTVRLWLPRCPDAGEGGGGARPAAPATGDEWILVVEDNQAVRETVTKMLMSLGYEVATASTVREAQAILDCGMRIDLLLTDVVMLGPLTGLDLAAWARERYPELRVVLTSGFPGEEPSLTGEVLLPKPYRRAELADTIRRALDRGPG